MTGRRLAVIFLAAMVLAAAGTLFYFGSAAPAVHANVRAKSSPVPSSRSVSPISLPMFFEANQGQTDPRAKFLSRGHGYALFLTSDEAVLSLHRFSRVEMRHAAAPSDSASNVIRMRLAGSNSAARVSGAELLGGKSNYFIGNDSSKWRRGIPQYGRVNYEAVYPGIDLTYYGNQGQLEYDFRVAPGADPKQIALTFDGASAKLNAGELVLSTGNGDVRFHAPSFYQQDGRAKKNVSGSFRQLAANKIGFNIGNYDRSRELVIDPILTYSTYLGGSGTEASVQVAVDSSLNIYVAGSTDSADFPLSQSPNPLPIQSTRNGAQNLFIAKLNPSAATPADQLAFATYLGGNGVDTPAGLAVDGVGDIYVAGTTTSSNFPTANAFRASPTDPGTHGFVSRIGFSGTVYALSYSTYLAGTNPAHNAADLVTGLAIDSKKDAFVTGTTTSTDPTTGFPATANGYQVTSLAASQFFASKIDTAASGASSMLYSTYFGGVNPANAQNSGGGIAVDNAGNFYITGATSFLFDPTAPPPPAPRTNFPIRNAQQACLDQAPSITTCDLTRSAQDAFLAKINPGRVGDAGLIYSTYLGGSQDDAGLAVAVDSAGSAYVTGKTLSSDWTPPTSPTPFQPNFVPGGSNIFDAFIAKVGNPSGSSPIFPLTYFTYLGGTGDDIGRAIAVDTVQTVHVTGSSSSGDLVPLDPLTIQPVFHGPIDAFVAQIITTASGRAIGDYLTFLGGTQPDIGTGIAIDASGTVYVSGQTQSLDFPIPSSPAPPPFQGQLNPSGLADAFVARIGAISGFAYDPTTPLTVSPTPASAGNQVTITFNFVNNGPDPASKVIFSGSFPSTGVTFNSATASPGGTCQTPVNSTVVCNIGNVAVAGKVSVTVVLTPLVGTKSVDITPSLSVDGGIFIAFPPPCLLPPANCLPVSVTDFSIGVAPTSVTITAGESTSYVVTLTPNPTYASAISVSQTGLPTASTGTFTSSSVTIPGSSPVTTTLNISTTARPVTTGGLLRGGPLYATWLPVGGLSLLGLGAGAGLKRRRWLAGMLLGLVAGLILLQAACGNSSSSTTPTGGTPAGTYSIRISGSSGTATHTQQVTLVVN